MGPIALLVCDVRLGVNRPVVIDAGLAGNDALCRRAVEAANMRGRQEINVVGWYNGLENEPFVCTEVSLGWARVHPDSWDTPEWPGLEDL